MNTDALIFTLQLRKPRKTPAKGPSMKAVRLVIASNGVPYLQMRSVGSHSTLGMEKEGNYRGDLFIYPHHTYLQISYDLFGLRSKDGIKHLKPNLPITHLRFSDPRNGA